ncbi:hypothetical protein SAMN05444266_108178 [Chitinophaga jiangningensis]|uniref:VOC domain-containing protein n=1 Tax=Chitinophaga jiangningensis TaxID=1419482 RepID=A0A1M7J2X5_9BACT|nr:VOC family protein [Chitinophaga jiangningensis]SHM46687.1 hypothetical protein SAMN05444266_108178 [Chitinophaga jiangningensis]
MITLSLIVLKTNQLQAQRDFYSLLGFQFDYHRHGNGPYHYASTGNPVVLEIYPLPKGITTPDTTTRLGFMVENLDILIDQLTASGYTIIVPPAQTDWGYSAVVQDCDGRKIELTQL